MSPEKAFKGLKNGQIVGKVEKGPSGLEIKIGTFFSNGDFEAFQYQLPGGSMFLDILSPGSVGPGKDMGLQFTFPELKRYLMSGGRKTGKKR